MTIPWLQHADILCDCLKSLVATNKSGAILEADPALVAWEQVTVACREAQRSVYLIGNGASASMASHFAADLCKNAHLRTEVFTDLAQVTAMGNDLGYDQIFAEPLRFRMDEGDMLVCISSSGQSPNVLRAVEAARECGGFVVTLTGMKESNALRGAGDLNFYISAGTYGLVETAHAAVLHYWMDRMADSVEQGC